MAAEAAANPIPNADLRSILFIAFLLTSRNEPPQKRRAHFVECEWWCEPKKASVSQESVPADGISAARLPRTAISAVPFQGQLHCTRPDAPEKQHQKCTMSQIG
jgi:hypothetical protein